MEKRILLHCCCAVCASSCIERLQEAGNQVVLFFSNCNIAPEEEYLRRLESMRRLAEISIDLDEFLRLLNSPKHELPEEEAEEMAEKIADLADTQNILIEKLQS